MIRIERTSDGYRHENGQWQAGGVTFTLALAHRAMRLVSGKTVVRYSGSIEKAHGLFVFAGVDDKERLTLVDHFGLRLRQVHYEHVHAVCQDKVQWLSEAVALDASAEAGV